MPLGNRQLLSVTGQPPLVTGPVLLVNCRHVRHCWMKCDGTLFSPCRRLATHSTLSYLQSHRMVLIGEVEASQSSVSWHVIEGFHASALLLGGSH